VTWTCRADDKASGGGSAWDMLAGGKAGAVGKAGVNYLRSCSSLVSCPIKVILVDLRGAAQSQAQLVVRHHIFTLLRIGVLQSIVRPEGYVSGLWLYDTLVEMY
jgi:hypothetical protein